MEGRCLPSTVTNLNDSGAGSLRQAIIDTPAGGTVDFQPRLSGIITLTSGTLAITKDLTIDGPGPHVIKVSGANTFQVFNVSSSIAVAISGLTIKKGNATDGGGVYNDGTLTVQDCILKENQARFGAGIYSDTGSTLTVSGSTFKENTAPIGFGGAIFIAHSTPQQSTSLVVDNSKFKHNMGQSGAGAIFCDQLSTCYIGDSILSHNLAEENSLVDGGAIINDGVMTIVNSRLTNNAAFFFGGAIANGSGTLTIDRSTISGNVADNPFGGGGGIYSNGTVSITNSTVSDNQAVHGGGILSTTPLDIRNSTISGNVAFVDSINNAGGEGGGIAVTAVNAATLISCTVTNNIAVHGSASQSIGGGLDGNIDRLNNTIVANNAADFGPDVAGQVNRSDSDFIGNGADSTGLVDGQNGNHVGNPSMPLDPMLEGLAFYGGPTKTERPMPTSPVLEAGDPTGYSETDTDQRGFPRLYTDPNTGMTTIDIGSVELLGSERTGPDSFLGLESPSGGSTPVLPSALLTAWPEETQAALASHSWAWSPLTVSSGLTGTVEDQLTLPEQARSGVRQEEGQLDTFFRFSTSPTSEGLADLSDVLTLPTGF